MTRQLKNTLPNIRADAKLPFPTEQELDAAVVRWDSNCPPFFVGLLSAANETDEKSKSRFVRSADGLRIYLRRGHKLITRKQILEAQIEYQKKVSGVT